MPFLSTRFSPYSYALMRIVVGALFALHGSQKILNFPPFEYHFPLASLPGVAGIIELVCGVLIVLGLFAPIAAFIASGEMAVAYFMGHASKGGHPFDPLTNKGELAVIYCFVFLFVASYGSGIWSLDSIISRGRTATRA